MNDPKAPTWEEIASQLRIRLVDYCARPLVDNAVPENLLSDAGLTQSTYEALVEKAEALDTIVSLKLDVEFAFTSTGHWEVTNPDSLEFHTHPTLLGAIKKARGDG